MRNPPTQKQLGHGETHAGGFGLGCAGGGFATGGFGLGFGGEGLAFGDMGVIVALPNREMLGSTDRVAAGAAVLGGGSDG